MRLSRAAWTTCSLSESRALVASSEEAEAQGIQSLCSVIVCKEPLNKEIQSLNDVSVFVFHVLHTLLMEKHHQVCKIRLGDMFAL
jgi:hypothetical protein